MTKLEELYAARVRLRKAKAHYVAAKRAVRLAIDHREEAAAEYNSWLRKVGDLEKELTPLSCAECGKAPRDPPSSLCPVCQAYREHTGGI